jgi:hypothetical protein
MLNIRTLDQLAKPCTLHLGVAGKIEHDRNTLRQKSANVWSERVLQSRRTLDESRNVRDLARKQGIQEIVLNKKDSILSNGQISCERGLACRYLPAEEHQLRRILFAHLGQKVSRPISKVPISPAPKIHFGGYLVIRPMSVFGCPEVYVCYSALRRAHINPRGFWSSGLLSGIGALQTMSRAEGVAGIDRQE